MSYASTHRRHSGKSFITLRQLRLTLLGLATATLLAACGGSGSDTATTGGGGGQQVNSCGTDCGTALLTMTDAQGDFLSYAVDVTSVQLQKANGAMVQTIPTTSRIDFAQLVDLSEVLGARQIPTGEYVAATLDVDFSNANIVVDDGTGTGVQVAPVDSNGQALGHVQLTVQLDQHHHLLIDHARIGRLAFDLDLAASNTVDLGAAMVTVSPFIVATVQPDATRQIRARGRLDSVDSTASTYTIDLRPFQQATDSSGQMVINTTSSTRFEINGAIFTGPEGLAQLSTLTDNPVTIAFGTIDATTQGFTAQRVLAADSAQDLRHDYISATVLARAGDTLTVGGVRLARHDGRIGFQLGHIAVTVGPNTRVTRDGQAAGTMDSSAISVGQHVEVYGDYADNSGHGSMDATSGRVRLNYTHLFGMVTAAVSGSDLTLSLQSIDGRNPARFDFTGTGATSADDADPAHYIVDAGALNVSGLQSGAYTKLFGFVTPFGAAPPDFMADTFVDLTAAHAGLALYWGLGGSTTPFSAMVDTGLTLDFASMPHGVITLGGRLVDISTLSAGLMLAPATDGTMSFAIAHLRGHKVENFSSFADFVTALNTDLDGTTALLGVYGDGTFDSAGGVFTTKRLLLVLSN